MAVNIAPTSGNTELAPEVANRVAGDHRTTAGDVDNLVRDFDTAIDDLRAVCKGRMVDAVDTARQQWDPRVKKIIDDLNEMARSVDGTVSDVEMQDSANASGIGSVGVGILGGL